MEIEKKQQLAEKERVKKVKIQKEVLDLTEKGIDEDVKKYQEFLISNVSLTFRYLT